jgi:catechol 2,3-dioxygenase-like lactoylglutathione lyase family enzyme
MSITTVKSIGMTVADMERSIDFYTTVCGFTTLGDRQVTGIEAVDEISLQTDGSSSTATIQLRVVDLQLGAATIALTEYITPKGRPIPPDARSNDAWFQHIAIVVSDMERAHQHLCGHQVTQTSPSPQTLPDWNPVAGGIQAFYFQDPDGHNLELIQFPMGKGDPEWQGTDLLFLGIDHTAIVVADTAASLAFYCDLLGMKLKQQSENFGVEQERLSGVGNARVRISRLHAPAGIGIELLEYLEPTDGRPIPTDTEFNDLWCWQTNIIVTDPLDTVQQLNAAQFPLISAEISVINELPLEFARQFGFQDPDRHIVRLVDPSKKATVNHY